MMVLYYVNPAGTWWYVRICNKSSGSFGWPVTHNLHVEVSVRFLTVSHRGCADTMLQMFRCVMCTMLLLIPRIYS